MKLCSKTLRIEVDGRNEIAGMIFQVHDNLCPAQKLAFAKDKPAIYDVTFLQVKESNVICDGIKAVISLALRTLQELLILCSKSSIYHLTNLKILKILLVFIGLIPVCYLHHCLRPRRQSQENRLREMIQLNWVRMISILNHQNRKEGLLIRF